MGTWGIGILQDDLASDVYGDYIEGYDAGVDPQENYLAQLRKYPEAAAGELAFWLGLAQAQWECGALLTEVVANINAFVRRNDDASRRGSQAADAAKRQGVITRFVSKLSKPRAQPRKRVQRRVHRPIFEPGTCLSVSLVSGGYGAAIVLQVSTGDRDTFHFVGGLRGVFNEPPDPSVFEERRWLYLSHGAFANVLHTVWCRSSVFKKDSEHFKISSVGSTSIRWDDPTDDASFPVAAMSSWGWIENQIRLQHQWDAKKSNAGGDR